MELGIRGGLFAVTRRMLPLALTMVASLLVSGLVIVATASPAQAAEGFVNAWGFNKYGELGNGTTEGTYVPVEVKGLGGVSSLAAGAHHSLALMEDGSVVAWGENFYGQLGNGTTEGSDVPVGVAGLGEVAAIAAGGAHSLALLKNGSVMAWGKSNSGQLGNGTTNGSVVPVQVKGLSEVSAIAAGSSFSLALLRSGKVVAWGENLFGQLGDGRREDSDVPVPVSGLDGVTAVSAGSWHSLALLSNGTVFAWGANEYGQLGDGTETARDVPTPVANLAEVGAVSAGHTHSIAIVPNGRLMAWGDNMKGQVGDGSRTGPEQCGTPPVFACSKLPVAVGGITEVAAVSAGAHSLALLADGTLMGWGSNNAGQLGNGMQGGPEICTGGEPCSASPVAVCSAGPESPCPLGPPLRNVTDVAAGEAHSLAIVAPPSSLPELGRCVRVAMGGAYAGTSPRCVMASATHDGRFEWLPGPGPNAHFIDTLQELKLETVAKHILSCASGLLEGEYRTAKTETISHVTLDGCLDISLHISCQTNPLEEGHIESSVALEGQLGFIKSGERPTVGWELQPTPATAPLVSFECGSILGATAVALDGSVIARAMPVDKMASVSDIVFKQKSGKQIPEFFELGPRDVLTLTRTPPTSPSTSEEVGMSAKGVRSGEAPLEIKAKP
jgi:alpha-tubulin suppressor-like RCC1 family protein